MLTQDKKLLLIGQITDLTGIFIMTIRYYESLSLINSLRRTSDFQVSFSLWTNSQYHQCAASTRYAR